MAAGDILRKKGASGWVTVATGLSLSADTWTQASSSTFADLLAAVEEDYPEFQIRLDVTTGTPAENDVVQICERLSDGTNAEIAPSGDFAPHYVGGVTLDNQTGNYYEDGIIILDQLATLYLKSPTAITVSVYILAKTTNVAQ